MKQGSSFLFATFLSLYAAAGLCTAEPLLQHGATSPGLDQLQARQEHQAQQERRAQSPPSQPRYQAPAPGEALSPSGLGSPSQLQQRDLQHPNSKQSLARRRFAASRRTNTGVCTFTISQVQRCTPDFIEPSPEPAQLISYSQIDTLYAPDSTIAADLVNQRPIAEHNSYQRLFADKTWDVESSEDDSRVLTITEGDEGDLMMSYGGVEWTEETRAEDEGAGWCEEAEWYAGAEDWSCPHGDTMAQRKRTVHCGFPCARIERIELR